eukprot:SAG31_NODE_9563_length_1258_cov_1.499569_1_plen_173_part_00
MMMMLSRVVAQLLSALGPDGQPAADTFCPDLRNHTAFHSAQSYATMQVVRDGRQECCLACVNNSSCASWTLQPHGLCHLKHAVPPDGGEYSAGSVSGIVRKPPPLPSWPPPPSGDKYNVLLVISDDMRPSLGAYGQPAISPHLDAFAAQGTLFQSAYVQVAWCCPSRNSFLS